MCWQHIAVQISESGSRVSWMSCFRNPDPEFWLTLISLHPWKKSVLSEKEDIHVPCSNFKVKAWHPLRSTIFSEKCYSTYTWNQSFISTHFQWKFWGERILKILNTVWQGSTENTQKMHKKTMCVAGKQCLDIKMTNTKCWIQFLTTSNSHIFQVPNHWSVTRCTITCRTWALVQTFMKKIMLQMGLTMQLFTSS